MTTKSRFTYDADRARESLRGRWKTLNHVDRDDAETILAWLRSDVRLSMDDRAEIASMIEALLLRGRQPGPSNQLQAKANEMLSEIRSRGDAERKATGRQRLPRGRQQELVREVHAEWSARVPESNALPDVDYLCDRIKSGR